MADTRIDDRIRHPTIADDCVFGIDTPEEALATLESRLHVYRSAPTASTKSG